MAESQTPQEATGVSETKKGTEARAPHVEREVNILGNSLLVSEGNKQLSKDPAESRTALVFHNVNFLRGLSSGQLAEMKSKQEKPEDEVALSGGEEDKPVFFKTEGGKVVQLETFVSVDDESGMVTMRTPQTKEGEGVEAVYRDGDEVTLSREDLAKAMLVAERDEALKAFDDPDQKMVAEAALLAQDPKRTEPLQPTDELDGALKNVADQKDMLTVDDMQALASKFPQESPEVNQMLDAVQGKILLEPNDITRILKAGVNPEGLSGKVQELQDQIAPLEARMASLGNNAPEAKADLQEQIDELKAGQKVCRELSTTLKNGGFDKVSSYFEKSQAGELDPETAKNVKEAFRSGKMDVLFNSIPELAITDETGDADKTKIEEKRKQVLDKIWTGTKYAGLGAGIIVALIAAAGVAVAATAASGMKQ